MKLKILSAPLFLLIGVLLSLTIYAVQATISSVNSGETLSVGKWNEVVNKINELESRMDAAEGNCSNPQLLFDSSALSTNPMLSGRYNDGVKAVPLECIDSTCLLKQEIYTHSTKALKAVKVFSYIQESTSGLYNSDYSTAGTYKNGDKSSNNFQKQYGNLLCRDDYYSSNSSYTREFSAGSWTFIDTDSTYDMKIYLCATEAQI